MRVGGVDYNYVYNCFSRLTAQDPKLQVQPDLATSWEAAEDLKTWTFHLRPGVKFHNGEELTAEDVKFSLERYRGAAAKSLKDRVANVDIHDPNRLTIRLKEPWPDFLRSAAAP